jgi:hypothetical protein
MKIFTFLTLIAIVFSCSNGNPRKKSTSKMNEFKKGTYGYDLNFLKAHTNPVELQNGDARIILSPEYQGRVMTSSAAGEEGLSYGWINYDLISSGEVVKHINPVGGEERFWLGPEGGQFSIFFKEGGSFNLDDWQTPACIDTEEFELIGFGETAAEFTKSVTLKNYSNFQFQLDINRKILLLTDLELKTELGIDLPKEIKSVGYKTINQLRNTGSADWKKETGLLSVWLLGMFNPSPAVTIVVPYKTGVESDYIVKDDYFGKIPDDRLIVKNGFVFLKGDGKQRGKIGIPPQRALPVLGSYDAHNKILTIVKTEIPEGVTGYVNSAWELQEFPYKGDAINSYNDGPVEDGGQLGPFYELETSSPALALKAGETASHSQATFHFQGSEEELDKICRQVLNISLDEIKAVF